MRNRIALQTEHITEGPQKGIIANPTAAEEYATTVRVMKKLEALSRGGEVLPLTRNTWMFMGNYRNAAFSAWLTGVDSVTLDRLEMYYSLNPGKRPDAVWVGEKNAGVRGGILYPVRLHRRDDAGRHFSDAGRMSFFGSVSRRKKRGYSQDHRLSRWS